MAFGYCSHHRHENEEISRDTFEYKGCWTCEQFNPADEYHLLDVKQVAKILKVSASRIYYWIKQKKLEAELFYRGRDSTFDGGMILGARKKYFIEKEILDNFKTKETQKIKEVK